MSDAQDHSKLLVDYLMRFATVPYRFGGNTPIFGLDCSGLALECLNAFGFKLPDQTAHDLWTWCKRSKFLLVRNPGALVFYGSKTKVTHVGIAITDHLMIEAGGGTSTTTSEVEADKRGAFVRIRPISRRGDLVDIYYPPYDFGKKD